jgi:hypothetical protein
LGQGLLTGTTGTRASDWDKDFWLGQLGQGLLTGTRASDWDNWDKGFWLHFYPILLIFQVAIKSLVPAKSPCPSQKPLSQLSQSKALVPVVPFKSTCPSCPNQKHLSQLFQSKVLVPVVPVKSPTRAFDWDNWDKGFWLGQLGQVPLTGTTGTTGTRTSDWDNWDKGFWLG